jgi:hypothetical protein
LDRVTAEQRATDGFYAMLEELDRKVSDGTLLTDEGNGRITGRVWRTPAIPFEWQGLPQVVGFAHRIWFRRCSIRARPYESVDLNELNNVCTRIDPLLSGGAALVVQREQIGLLINFLARCSQRLPTRAQAQIETIEGIILWVKWRVADCNTHYRRTPLETLVGTTIEELSAGADLVELHTDNESLVNFLMEHLDFSRNAVDQRLSRLRQALEPLLRQSRFGGDPPDEDDEDASPGWNALDL